jgi:hypothetical protein
MTIFARSIAKMQIDQHFPRALCPATYVSSLRAEWCGADIQLGRRNALAGWAGGEMEERSWARRAGFLAGTGNREPRRQATAQLAAFGEAAAQ